ncbi:MAG: hypothetical protein RSD23_01830 [Ruthenibacterium sp.]
MPYADYCFYITEYQGKMSGEEFARYVVHASRQIDSLTFDRARTASIAMLRRLQLCCCAVADALQTQDMQNAMTHNGTLASENVNGYGVSYQNQGTDAQRQAALKIELRNICADYLTAPINLMYRGCG